MNDRKLAFAMAAVVIAMVLIFALAWQIFKWHECFKVGHSFFYCLLES